MSSHLSAFTQTF